MSRIAVLTTAVVSLVHPLSTVAAEPAPAPSPSVTRTFAISADPAVAILHVAFEGDTTGIDSHYRVFGDGRFHFQRVANDGTLVEERETRLSFDEVHELVRTVVDHGIVDITSAALVERIEAKTGRPLIKVIDAGVMFLTLELDDYAVHGNSQGPQTKRFMLGSPKAVHRSAPAEPEPAGLVQLTEALYEIRRRSSLEREEEHR
jgi:hypothetical protein